MSVAHLHKPNTLPILVLFMQFSLLFTIVFDIPVARQVIGFLFLTLIPGYTIVRLLKLKLEKVETLLFSVGLSLAFLMISTFFMNLTLPLIGIDTPLAAIPLLLLVNGMAIVLVVTEWRSSLNVEFSVGSIRLAVFGILFAVPLMLTLMGVFLVRIPPHTNNPVLLTMLVTIAALITLSVLTKRFFPQEAYPLLLLVVAISLLLHISLFSSYLQGGDIFGEYFVFRLTAINSYWDPTLVSRLSAMLSITVLPTAYSHVLNLSPTWVFKLVYPLILAFVPLGLYQLYKSQLGIEVGFFSAFFFVSNFVFFTEIAQLARQIIGELFYVLLFLTLFTKNAKGSKKWLLFFAFAFGLVVSHYAMALIFLVFLTATWAIGIIRKSNTRTTASLIVLLGILAFAWYIYTSQASTFNDLLNTVNYVRTGFASDFFNPQSRSTQVLTAVGASGISTYWHSVGRYVFYATEGLIIVGFIFSLLKEKWSFLDDDHNVLIFLNLTLLGALIVVPNFSSTFNATRFYHVTLFLLAPLSVLGAINIVKFLSRKKIKEKFIVGFLVLFLLIPFFFFQTGFVYEVTNEESYSLPLSSYRFDPLFLANLGVITESEVSSGTWLAKYAGWSETVYADVFSSSIFIQTHVLIAGSVLSSTPIPSGSYVYLREYNIANNVVFFDYGQSVSYNLTQITPPLSDSNLIYSGGFCEIYRTP